MKNWDKILKDFSHKCKGGEPDFTNSTHLNYLRESILKYDEEFRNNIYALNEFIGNLRNGKEIVTEDWWSDMTPAQQAQYIKDHPKSQKALDAKGEEGGGDEEISFEPKKKKEIPTSPTLEEEQVGKVQGNTEQLHQQ